MAPRGLEDYVEVHVRIAQFWEKHPRGRIETHIDYPDDNTVRCRAEVFRENTVDSGLSNSFVADVGGVPPAATGHAEEKRDMGHVNKTSAVENAETSAVGRALAILGFSIYKGVASREEVEIARRKAGATNGAQTAAQGLPALYVDCLRLAIRSRDSTELVDEAEWASLVGAAKSNDQKKALVDGLEAKLRDLDMDPSLVRDRWEASRVKAGT